MINLKKDKNVRTPPVIKEPRPLLTMGDVWNVAFTVVAFLLQKASGAILTFVKIPYNAVNGVIKAINKIPLAGKLFHCHYNHSNCSLDFLLRLQVD